LYNGRPHCKAGHCPPTSMIVFNGCGWWSAIAKPRPPCSVCLAMPPWIQDFCNYASWR
jgi:hypothetical protein